MQREPPSDRERELDERAHEVHSAARRLRSRLRKDIGAREATELLAIESRFTDGKVRLFSWHDSIDLG